MPRVSESDTAATLPRIIGDAIAQAGGWIGFDAFMQLALYTPGLGYYDGPLRKFGSTPASGSDFVTAPEMTPLFGRVLAAQVADALTATGTREVWEFGAGSGALAEQLLGELGTQIDTYTIVDVSGSLRDRQQARLQAYGDQVRWVSALPEAMQGVVVGNEVLDAMPIKLLARVAGQWLERGVTIDPDGQFVWEDRPTNLRPPVEPEGPHDYVTEIHPQAEAFVQTLADRLRASGRGGVAFFIDYGFAESEYYHPQRHMGTVMCHRAHLADPDPLSDVGCKDITAHVNFTSVALAAQDAGLDVLGYTTQARFLMNCGLLSLADQQPLSARVHAQKLIMEHEMGELFKVIALGVLPQLSADAPVWIPMGFAHGDRTHTL
jgi:SAM-dependent MidA family methyltransferase